MKSVIGLDAQGTINDTDEIVAEIFYWDGKIWKHTDCSYCVSTLRPGVTYQLATCHLHSSVFFQDSVRKTQKWVLNRKINRHQIKYEQISACKNVTKTALK